MRVYLVTTGWNGYEDCSEKVVAVMRSRSDAEKLTRQLDQNDVEEAELLEEVPEPKVHYSAYVGASYTERGGKWHEADTRPDRIVRWPWDDRWNDPVPVAAKVESRVVTTTRVEDGTKEIRLQGRVIGPEADEVKRMADGLLEEFKKEIGYG